MHNLVLFNFLTSHNKFISNDKQLVLRDYHYHVSVIHGPTVLEMNYNNRSYSTWILRSDGLWNHVNFRYERFHFSFFIFSYEYLTTFSQSNLDYGMLK